MIKENLELQKKTKEGIDLIESNNFLEAEKIFDKFLENNETEITGLFFLGIISIKKKENYKAKELFLKILSINEFHLEANFNLALVYFGEDNYDEAITYFNICIKINDKHLPSYYHKGLVYMVRDNYDDAIKYFDICNNIDEKFIPTSLNLGNIYLRKNEFKKSIHYYQKILKLTSDKVYSNLAKFNIAWNQLAQCNLKEGFENYEVRNEKPVVKKQVNELITKYSCKEWQSEDLNNKTILILSEQGLGDNIQFFRYLFWLKDKFNVNIIFYINKKKSHLFKDTPFKIVSDLKNITDVDYYKFLMSLPKMYFIQNESFPKLVQYIEPNEAIDLKWKDRLQKLNKPVIALNWQGDRSFMFDKTRSIALSNFKNILKLEKYAFISLQKGFGSEQIKSNKFENYLTDLSDEIDNGNKSFEDTIGILKNVECLITSDTSIAHLAGTLNVKTYLLLSFNPEWRWFIEKKYKVFYPNIKIIQQNKPGDWVTVFEKVENIISR